MKYHISTLTVPDCLFAAASVCWQQSGLARQQFGRWPCLGKMLNGLFWIVMLSCVPLTLLAQEAPQVEVFAGYSFLRAHDSFSTGLNQNGWDVSAAFNFARSFGVVADFSNHYGTSNNFIYGPNSFSPIGTQGKGATFLFGPQYTYRRGARPSPFVHALFGGIRASRLVPPTMVIIPGDDFIFVPGTGCTTIFCYRPETNFAMALGGGLDVKATKNVWIRAFQVEYFRTNLSNPDGTSAAQNDFRISTGIVFRFGKR